VAVKISGVTYYYALTVTRPALPTPPAILRSVTLPSVDGASTSPPAGIHRVGSGSDFVFTLTPTGIGTRSSAPPVVRTNRADTPDDVLVTPNADGTYTVRIYAVRSNITLSIDLATGNAEVAGDRVWSFARTLYIYATHDGTARIYGVTGALVKAIPYAAGETVQSVLPQGMYIVVTNGRTYKIVISE
jgi:hypothetical protein